MQTEAVFENIADRIQSEIGKAQKSIFIAVAWFTNKNIYNELIKKAKADCKVSLIISNDEINSNSQINFAELELYGSKCFKVGNGETELMHNKFCVIDYSTVITGSYNWSYKAEMNFENVIVNYNDTALAEQFISEFNQIRKQYFPDEPRTETIFPLEKIIKRLEILRNYILLEDIEEVDKETAKLSEYDFNADLLEITSLLKNKEYGAAISKIQNFISIHQQLAIWSDPEIAALKLEVKNLENQVNAFDNEKIELEKVLTEFHYHHSIVLGHLILEILKLRKQKFKDDKKEAEEAENDYKQYSEQFEKEKKKKKFELTEEEQTELKQKFRKSTFLCHPDKVSDELKETAQKIFVELKAAYDANDLKKVTAILNDLEKGNYFKSQSDTVAEKEKLKSLVTKLRNHVNSLAEEIKEIKESETYKTIVSIKDWNEYFVKTKEQLQSELDDLKKAILV